MTYREEGRSIGDLLGDLGRQTGTLVRKEIDLAKVEVTSSVGRMSKGAATAGIGGALAYAGLIVTLLAIAFLLAETMPTWLATLIVGVIALVVGGLIAMSGVNRIKSTDMAPKQTAETVKENVEFVKEQIK
jgi:hypothetical protein